MDLRLIVDLIICFFAILFLIPMSLACLGFLIIYGIDIMKKG